VGADSGRHQRDQPLSKKPGRWVDESRGARASLRPAPPGGAILRSESTDAAALGLTENLSGTRFYSELIDAIAREGAALNKVELRDPLDAVRPLVPLQGSISVSDYLITRCVEAVVHGSDLVSPVVSDPSAQAITSQALLDTLSVVAPDLAAEARALPVKQ